MKRLIALLLVLAMTVCLAACGAGETENASTGEQTISNQVGINSGEEDETLTETDDSNVEKTVTVGIIADPTTWDPWASFNPGRKHTAGVIYQTLVALVTNPETSQVVAYNVMISGYEQLDESTFRVTLREGIYDTAGNPFTANDAKFSLDSAKEKGTMGAMNDMNEVTVVDELTFDVTVNSTMAVGDFEELLSTPNMVTQAAYEASPDGMLMEPVGTTGYVLSDYVAGSSCTFTKSETPYWNEKANESRDIENDGFCFLYDTTKVDTIVYKVITDTSTMAIALESGDIDIASSVASNDMLLFNNNPDYSVASVPGNIMYLVTNCSTDSPMQNENLRKAVAYCFDSSDALSAAYDGDGVVAKAWGYPSQIGYQSEWDSDEYDYFGYDLEKAQEYLQAYYEETGTSAGDLHLRLLCTTDSAHVKIAEVIQASLNALVGADCCELLQYETNSFNEVKSDSTAYDMYLYWGLANKPYVLYNWNLSANAERSSSGLSGFKIVDEQLQTLLNACLSVDTFSDETCKAFQEYVNEKCYTVCICTGNSHWVASNWIKSFAIGSKDAVVANAMTYDWSAKN